MSEPTSDATTPLDSEERPWGSWQVIDVEDGFKVKTIRVQPHSRLSYQTHEHRSEHWVVVKGTATCLVDDVEVVAHVGHSVDVALGAKHRIANEHDEELVIVEVQLGSYTGEDDIVRLQDDYGR
ncbi:cupin domain-containing protein [Nocardioides mangrovicus]|uniref:Cupin domain-containing protein n=1 Tax=Nocardioides mangrovicus TaxID=2478913 RepID=A0A3L8NYE7_9ACTN|nr:phosphomannose isomerase type II C-terminal cupin domain [Nocardioides mangrovicus]RLV47667.1 cupin domain-containing protein [Nocardioides mangrovicus]